MLWNQNKGEKMERTNASLNVFFSISMCSIKYVDLCVRTVRTPYMCMCMCICILCISLFPNCLLVWISEQLTVIINLFLSYVSRFLVPTSNMIEEGRTCVCLFPLSIICSVTFRSDNK